MSPRSPAPAASPDAESAADLLFPDFTPEHAATRRFLERYPEGQHEWRPHPRSRTIAQLATHVAGIPHRGVAILTTDELDAAMRRPPAPVTTSAELVALHEAGVAELQTALQRADLAALSAEWVFRHGAQILARGSKRVLLRRMMMSHLIHHRAQLGVYYRLLGVSVPGVYGPSADDAP